MAGAVDLFGKAGHHSPPINFSDLQAADPDVIIVAACGYDLARATAEMHWLTERPEWRTLAAVRNHRVFVADGNQYFNRPGPRLVETLQILAEILQPSGFRATLEGAGWNRIE
jgi:iron complex transport system substrate-binding protein